jgi:dihydrofolate reductase
MRKLIVANIVSLDGYYEGPNRNVMALPMDHSFDAYNAERLRAADTLLLGANCYGMFKGFWPQMKEHPQATPVHREISRLNDAIEKVVVSDRLQSEQTDPWRSTTRILRRAEAQRQIAALKQGPGRDILVFGSRTLWNDLLSAGLVDELHLMVGAVVLGGGTPAFLQAQPAPFRLIDTRRWEGSSNVLFQYAVEPATAR